MYYLYPVCVLDKNWLSFKFRKVYVWTSDQNLDKNLGLKSKLGDRD